jgi:hypothetical protein
MKGTFSVVEVKANETGRKYSARFRFQGEGRFNGQTLEKSSEATVGTSPARDADEYARTATKGLIRLRNDSAYGCLDDLMFEAHMKELTESVLQRF